MAANFHFLRFVFGILSRTSLLAEILILSLEWTPRTGIYMAWTALNGTGCMDQNAKEEARTRPLTRNNHEGSKPLQDFDCIVTSTWANNEDNREFHMWRAGGLRSRLHMLYDVVPK